MTSLLVWVLVFQTLDILPPSLTALGRHNRRRKFPRLYARMNRDSLTRLATNQWHDSRVQFRAYKGRLSPLRPRRDDHSHRRTEALAHADRRGSRTSHDPLGGGKRFLMTGQGFEKTRLISEVVTVERLITAKLGFDAPPIDRGLR